MRGLFVCLVIVCVLAGTAVFAQTVEDLTTVRFDYIQLGLWLAVGNAIGVPLGTLILAFLQRAWKNITE